MNASPSVASATDGAAPKIPAKLLGFSMSPSTENTETTTPPITNRRTRSVHIFPSSSRSPDWLFLPELNIALNGRHTARLVVPNRTAWPRQRVFRGTSRRGTHAGRHGLPHTDTADGKGRGGHADGQRQALCGPRRD